MNRYPPGERLAGAAGALGMVGLLIAGLIWGLAAGRLPGTRQQPNLMIVPVTPAPPARQRQSTPPHPSRATKRKSAPPNLRTLPTPIVASPPIIPATVPPPVIAAPVPATGLNAQTGNSDRPGIGNGAGGIGNGTGGGGDGEGEGYTPPRQIRGALRNSDLPVEILHDQDAAGLIGAVGVRYHVDAAGRVSRCTITEPSGKPELDRITCGLIETRFRFRPSLDPSGRPIGSNVVETHSWAIIHDERPADRE